MVRMVLMWLDGSKKAAVGDANFNYSNGEDGENCIVQVHL